MRARSDPVDGIGSLTDALRYDLVLAAIPAAFLFGAVCGALAPLSFLTGVGAGSALAAALVGYALFVAAPTDAGERERSRRGGRYGRGPSV